MNGAPEPGTAIEATGVVKRYGATLALDRLSVHLPAGRILAMVGPNGAGKTTLTRIVGTLLRPDAGRVKVYGHDVLTDPWRVRQMLAVVPQGGAPDPAVTPWEHVYLYLRARNVRRPQARARAEEALRDLQLWDRRDEPAGELSGGYARRVLLAMALATGPGLLLLDEPTTALDPVVRRRMWNLLAALRSRCAILLTTHDIAEAQTLGDRVAMIAEGRLAAYGPPAELLQRLPYAEKFVLAEAPVPLHTFGQVEELAGQRVVYPFGPAAARALADALLAAGASFSVRPADLEDVYLRLLAGRGPGGPPALLAAGTRP